MRKSVVDCRLSVVGCRKGLTDPLLSHPSSFILHPSKVFSFLLLYSLFFILAACGDDPTRAPSPTQNPAKTPLPGVTTATASVGQVKTSATTTVAPSPTATNDLLKIPPTASMPITPGGGVVGAQIQEANTLHYYKTTNPAAFSYLKLLFSASLTRRNPLTLAVEKGAAESWAVDSTRNTVTFKLKPGLKWSDGQPLTADDYLWTYQQASKPENSWPYANSVGIDSYTASDPLTLVVKLKSYTFDIVSRADVIEPLPRHTWEKLDWNDASKNPEINKPSVVSGPWLLKSWQQGEAITFIRNPNSSLYPSPLLDNLTFKIVADSQVASQWLKTGEVDFFSPESHELASFEQLPNLQTFRWTPGRSTFQYVGFNFRKSYLQDKVLRQAIAQATDKAGILNRAGPKVGQLTQSSVAPWLPQVAGNLARYDFDLNKAKDALKNAGYSGIGTKLVDSKGAVVPTLRIVYTTPSLLHEDIAQSLRQNLTALGLGVELQGMDFSNYVKLIGSDQSNYDLFISGWQTDLDPENFADIWQNVPELNNGAYRNDKLLELYNTALREADAAKRKNLIAQTQQIEADDLPYVFLYAEYDWLTINKRVQGVAQTFLGPSYNLYTDWYVSR